MALTREHDGWESRLGDGHPAAQSGQVPCSGARRQGKVLDVVSATIHGDEVAVNTIISRGAHRTGVEAEKVANHWGNNKPRNCGCRRLDKFVRQNVRYYLIC